MEDSDQRHAGVQSRLQPLGEACPVRSLDPLRSSRPPQNRKLDVASVPPRSSDEALYTNDGVSRHQVPSATSMRPSMLLDARRFHKFELGALHSSQRFYSSRSMPPPTLDLDDHARGVLLERSLMSNASLPLQEQAPLRGFRLSEVGCQQPLDAVSLLAFECSSVGDEANPSSPAMADLGATDELQGEDEHFSPQLPGATGRDEAAQRKSRPSPGDFVPELVGDGGLVVRDCLQAAPESVDAETDGFGVRLVRHWEAVHGVEELIREARSACPCEVDTWLAESLDLLPCILLSPASVLVPALVFGRCRRVIRTGSDDVLAIDPRGLLPVVSAVRAKQPRKLLYRQELAAHVSTGAEGPYLREAAERLNIAVDDAGTGEQHKAEDTRGRGHERTPMKE